MHLPKSTRVRAGLMVLGAAVIVLVFWVLVAGTFHLAPSLHEG